jgi:Ca-activated chloride channel family protein
VTDWSGGGGYGGGYGDRVDAAAANDILRDKLAQARKQYQGSKNVVFYLGSGAGGSKAPQGSFSPGDLVSGGAVLGYGTPAGGPIPRSYVDGGLIYMADQQTGAALISVLGVNYFHRERGQSISAVVPAVTAALAPDSNPVVASHTVERTELYWLFSLLAAALVLVEIYLTARDYRRNRVARQDVTP